MEHVTSCPVCDSAHVEHREETESIGVPYGPRCTFMRGVDICHECGESGDFENVNDQRIRDALDEAVKKSVAAMLDHLSQAGLSMAYLERALDLPQRTMARWKGGECSAAGVALLRVVRTFPWIVRVAEVKFAREAADAAIVEESAAVLSRLVNQANLRATAKLQATNNSFQIVAELRPGAQKSAILQEPKEHIRAGQSLHYEWK
jgi:hypothetical protein